MNSQTLDEFDNQIQALISSLIILFHFHWPLEPFTRCIYNSFIHNIKLNKISKTTANRDINGNSPANSSRPFSCNVCLHFVPLLQRCWRGGETEREVVKGKSCRRASIPISMWSRNPKPKCSPIGPLPVLNLLKIYIHSSFGNVRRCHQPAEETALGFWPGGPTGLAISPGNGCFSYPTCCKGGGLSIPHPHPELRGRSIWGGLCPPSCVNRH